MTLQNQVYETFSDTSDERYAFPQQPMPVEPSRAIYSQRMDGDLTEEQVQQYLSKPNRLDPESSSAIQTSETASSTPLEASKEIPLRLAFKPVQRRDPFIPLQSWEGCVLEVLDESFVARLTDTSGGDDTGEEDVELPLEEVDESDQSLVEPGAIFYWTIGYLDRPSGRLRTSMIRFRRLPAWSKRDLQKASSKAKWLGQIFEDCEDGS